MIEDKLLDYGIWGILSLLLWREAFQPAIKAWLSSQEAAKQSEEALEKRAKELMLKLLEEASSKLPRIEQLLTDLVTKLDSLLES